MLTFPVTVGAVGAVPSIEEVETKVPVPPEATVIGVFPFGLAKMVGAVEPETYTNI